MTTGWRDSRGTGGAPLFGVRAKSSGSKAEAGAATSASVAGSASRVSDNTELAHEPVGDDLRGSLKRPMTVGTAPVAAKKGRRARLTLKRIDPWTTLKFSFVYGLAGMVVLLVSVIVLYGIVDAMGVISSIRNFIITLSDSDSSSPSVIAWLSFGRVMLVAVVVGLVNVILFTAFTTLTAFIYNVCTDIVGGVEITLAERN